jgi:hypothetical protein
LVHFHQMLNIQRILLTFNLYSYLDNISLMTDNDARVNSALNSINDVNFQTSNKQKVSIDKRRSCATDIPIAIVLAFFTTSHEE